ncbi:MAG: hypothetical protein AVDCRST_MAG13-3483, partial [uncultured Solirubrobacteraceae bacterium]
WRSSCRQRSSTTGRREGWASASGARRTSKRPSRTAGTPGRWSGGASGPAYRHRRPGVPGRVSSRLKSTWTPAPSSTTSVQRTSGSARAGSGKRRPSRRSAAAMPSSPSIPATVARRCDGAHASGPRWPGR